MPHWCSQYLLCCPVCRRCLWLLWLLAHSPVFRVSVIRPRPGPGSLASGQWTLTLPTIRDHQGSPGRHTITSDTEGDLSSSCLRGQRRIAGWGSEGRRALVTGDNGQSWAQPVREPEPPGAGAGWAGGTGPRGRAGQPIGGQWVDNRPIVDNSCEPGLPGLLAPGSGARLGSRRPPWPVSHNRGYRGTGRREAMDRIEDRGHTGAHCPLFSVPSRSPTALCSLLT